MAPQRHGNERQQQRQGQDPTPERQGERRDIASEGARYQGIAGPAQVGQQQAEQRQRTRMLECGHKTIAAPVLSEWERPGCARSARGQC